MTVCTWQNVEAALHTLSKPVGGFSSAHRGIVTLADGTQVFVKIGIDDNTKNWAKKEIETYRFLERHDYPFAPKLLACNPDETAFALEVLGAGWDWTDTWAEARLTKTLAAMDVLAAIKPIGKDADYFNVPAIDETADGWRPLQESPELQRTLLGKLRAAGHDKIADMLGFAKESNRSTSFVFRRDSLVHNDVRADNCAWSEKMQTVRLVDWNWTQLGDRRIDLSATLVHVHKSGFDVLSHHTDRLDADALHWLAGFWLKSAATPIWPGGPADLRNSQLESAVAALQLEKGLR